MKITAITIAIASFAMSPFASSLAAQNIVNNPSFESPVTSVPMSLLSAGMPIDGWWVSAGSVEVSRTWQTAHGQQSIDLNGNERGTIYQSLSTVSGRSYRIRFALSGNPNPSGGTLKSLRVTWGDSQVADVSFETAGRTTAAMGWTYHEFVVTATNPTTRLGFQSTSGAVSGAALDDVTVSIEPINKDLNGNGLSDIWERQFGVTFTAAQALLDSDGDGFTNIQESEWGTNPLSNAHSPHPRVTSENGFAVVRATIGAGKKYSIETATALEGPWTSITGIQESYSSEIDCSFGLAGQPQRFFRVNRYPDVDEDNDGLTHYEELLLGGSDKSFDTDSDGTPDIVEALANTPVNGAADSDADHILDAFDASPANPDTNNNCIPDGRDFTVDILSKSATAAKTGFLDYEWIAFNAGLGPNPGRGQRYFTQQSLIWSAVLDWRQTQSGQLTGTPPAPDTGPGGLVETATTPFSVGSSVLNAESKGHDAPGTALVPNPLNAARNATMQSLDSGVSTIHPSYSDPTKFGFWTGDQIVARFLQNEYTTEMLGEYVSSILPDWGLTRADASFVNPPTQAHLLRSPNHVAVSARKQLVKLRSGSGMRSMPAVEIFRPQNGDMSFGPASYSGVSISAGAGVELPASLGFGISDLAYVTGVEQFGAIRVSGRRIDGLDVFAARSGDTVSLLAHIAIGTVPSGMSSVVGWDHPAGSSAGTFNEIAKTASISFQVPSGAAGELPVLLKFGGATLWRGVIAILPAPDDLVVSVNGSGQTVLKSITFSASAGTNLGTCPIFAFDVARAAEENWQRVYTGMDSQFEAITRAPGDWQVRAQVGGVISQSMPFTVLFPTIGEISDDTEVKGLISASRDIMYDSIIDLGGGLFDRSKSIENGFIVALVTANQGTYTPSFFLLGDSHSVPDPHPYFADTPREEILTPFTAGSFGVARYHTHPASPVAGLGPEYENLRAVGPSMADWGNSALRLGSRYPFLVADYEPNHMHHFLAQSIGYCYWGLGDVPPDGRAKHPDGRPKYHVYEIGGFNALDAPFPEKKIPGPSGPSWGFIPERREFGGRD